MKEKMCETCGSVYGIRAVMIPIRETDHEECEVCGETLVSWYSETTMYISTLKEKHENHKK